MKLVSRAATTAAAISGIALLAGTTSPGFALELETSKVPIVSTPQLQVEQTLPPGSDTPTEEQAPAAEAAAPVAFASLADAVAAQAMPADIDEELRCLAIGVYFEARSESQSGQLAVAEVILNRVDSPRFPNTVCGVLKQPGQFSFVRGGKLPAVDTTRPMWRNAVAIAQVARDQHWQSPAADAMFFHARRVAPGWRLAKVASVGNHVFYR
ncbi:MULTISPECIES: cell wall hydrolase [unclassified Sphingomonas]|jgi:spore germination cell wall hydrolase CwlJ-like protein|uniref:cell wall hydrolase n=1 Tax=unclassified Sphingomonas TaxID=196159 RepID=UPI00082AFD51|nr:MULTISPECIES: cell wall hydrolase [unclassified Sphingomonas]